MKRNSLTAKLILTATMIFTTISCSNLYYDDIHSIQDDNRIYLYGEKHGQEVIYNKEIELWEEYYTKQNFTHLFVESGYCAAQLLNLWMKADDNEYLDVVYQGLKGTLSYTEARYNFYLEIKKRCPNTIFHGTDVEHQYFSTGKYYLNYLIDNDLKDTEEYELAEQCCQQGNLYRNGDGTRSFNNETYRENTMVSNFKREFDSLPQDEKIMGIYGVYHTKLNFKNGKVKNMATQLNNYYAAKTGNIISSVDLTKMK